MTLKENIKKILEQETKDKDLTPVLENMLNKLLVKNNKDILCGVKVVHPDNRESLPDAFGNNIKFTSYKVTFIFIGGYGTKYWPKTQAVRDKYESLMDEAWNLIYDITELPVDVYSSEVKKCD
jgi:hypothetical protein